LIGRALWRTVPPSFETEQERPSDMAANSPFDAQEARGLIAERRSLPGAMLPILHALQERYGYIDATAIPLIAEALNLSKAETLGVVSFYRDFRRRPARGRVLKICRAESCQAMGCEALVARLETKLGVTINDDADAAFSLETVYCLGNCALSPAALLDGELIGRLDADGVDALVAAAQSRRQ
jgi:formate dehydrogenase subunit gamma